MLTSTDNVSGKYYALVGSLPSLAHLLLRINPPHRFHTSNLARCPPYFIWYAWISRWIPLNKRTIWGIWDIREECGGWQKQNELPQHGALSSRVTDLLSTGRLLTRENCCRFECWSLLDMMLSITCASMVCTILMCDWLRMSLFLNIQRGPQKTVHPLQHEK